MTSSFRLTSALAAMLLVSGPLTAGEMYKWVDDKGVVNYSNEPPAKTKGGKAPTIVEDRVSVYTPEKAVTEEMERNKNRRPQAASRGSEPERRAKAAPPPPPPPVAYDPCANPNDPDCQPGVIYDGSPVFHGRRRPRPHVQPHLPPGAIAGQIAGPDAYIAGQSASAPPIVQPARPLRDKERETSRRQP